MRKAFLAGFVGMAAGLWAQSLAGTDWPLPIGFGAMICFGAIGMLRG